MIWKRTERASLAPVIAELVLSKSTLSLPSFGAKERIRWFSNDFCATIFSERVLALWILAIFAVTITPFLPQLEGHASIFLHPAFLFQAVFAVIGVTAVLAILQTLASLATVLRTVNVKDCAFFPDVLRVRGDLLELCWNKQRRISESLFIPWSWISRIKLIDCYYAGVFRMKVLELDLQEIPAGVSPRTLLCRLGGEGLYRDAHSQMLSNFKVGGIRIPLAMFAFVEDAQFLIETIRKQNGNDVIDGDTQLELESAGVESFTTLWLSELQSGKSGEIQSRTLSPGSELFDGAYKVNEILGYGAFSVVYGATFTGAPGESSPVAIKEIVCNPGGSRAAMERNVANIMSEVTLLKDLNHPNIVEFREFFVDRDRLYLVMNAVPGITLRDYGSGRLITENELLEIALQCCSILDYLHNRPHPILHRDFTPDNLIVHARHVTLVDFNVAQAAMTMASAVVGKHCYMAPEQFCGEYTISGDLYQLGKTLYYLGAGTEPEPLTRADLSDKRPDLSPNIISIIAMLTERDPECRFGSAAKAAAAIRLHPGTPVDIV